MQDDRTTSDDVAILNPQASEVWLESPFSKPDWKEQADIEGMRLPQIILRHALSQSDARDTSELEAAAERSASLQRSLSRQESLAFFMAADRHLQRLRSLSLVSAASAPTLQPNQDGKTKIKQNSEGKLACELSCQSSTDSMDSAELTLGELPQGLVASLPSKRGCHAENEHDHSQACKRIRVA